jgi:hypothetical protein
MRPLVRWRLIIIPYHSPRRAATAWLHSRDVRQLVPAGWFRGAVTHQQVHGDDDKKQADHNDRA